VSSLQTLPSSHLRITRSLLKLPGSHLRITRSLSELLGSHLHIMRTLSGLLGSHLRIMRTLSGLPLSCDTNTRLRVEYIQPLQKTNYHAMYNLFLKPLSKPLTPVATSRQSRPTHWLPYKERGFDSCSPSLQGKGLGVRFQRKLHTA